MNKKLYLDQQHKVIGGVCAGLADYLNIDVTIIRILFLITFIFKGGGGLLYIILWIAVPKRPFGSISGINPGVDYMAQPGTADYTTNYPRKTSNGRTIGGMILILVGLLFLLNEFDMIPDFDFEYFWPTLLIIVGLVFIFTSRHKTPVNTSDNPFDENSPKL